VYLITGGAGGLGLIFAREIAIRRRRDADPHRSFAADRSAMPAEFAELEALGATVRYRVLDVGDRDAVHETVREAVAEFGQLHGIIHSAGVLRDSFMLKKTPEELARCCAPKSPARCIWTKPVATWRWTASCLLVVAGAVGNVGQADYAAANAFMDAFAHHRATW
jgi:NAD(P)-dependent dehydrogenase (short-subunit alcohol dehydrogenase family)